MGWASVSQCHSTVWQSVHVLMPLSRQWRDRDLRRRIEVWGPRVGERATTTFTRGRHLLLLFTILVGGWALVNIALEFGGLTGYPIASAVILFWPAALYAGIRGVRLSVRGMHQAGEVAAISNKVAVPVRTVQRFDAWIKDSKYSRFANQTS